jgi:hypothetical protein
MCVKNAVAKREAQEGVVDETAVIVVVVIEIPAVKGLNALEVQAFRAENDNHS